MRFVHILHKNTEENMFVSIKCHGICFKNAVFRPTANAAMGAVDKELSRMRKEAARPKALHRQGRLTPQQFSVFTGICW